MDAQALGRGVQLAVQLADQVFNSKSVIAQGVTVFVGPRFGQGVARGSSEWLVVSWGRRFAGGCGVLLLNLAP